MGKVAGPRNKVAKNWKKLLGAKNKWPGTEKVTDGAKIKVVRGIKKQPEHWKQYRGTGKKLPIKPRLAEDLNELPMN